MTVEQLHDAIGLLPSDLIAQVDARRCPAPKRIPLRRYAAMAACLGLIVCGALTIRRLTSAKGALDAVTMMGAEQAACEMAPEEGYEAAPLVPETPAEDRTVNQNSTAASGYASDTSLSTVQVSTPCAQTAVNTTSGDPITLITSREELISYWCSNDIRYDFSQMRPLCDGYDETWFETHDLLLNVVSAADIRERWWVAEIMEGSNGWDWEILLSHDHPADTDGAAALVHLMTPLEKGKLDSESAMIQIYEVISPE